MLHRQPTPSTPPAHARRAHLLLIGVYALTGFMMSSWLARVPSVREHLHLTTAGLGVVLLVGSLGALGAVLVSGALHQRLGSARLLAGGAVAISSGYALIGVGAGLGSVAAVACGVVVNGAGGALANVAMNVESARIERAFGRTVIPHFHAGFSAGAVTGSIAGALSSAAGIGVQHQLGLVAVLGLAGRLAAVRGGVVLAAASVTEAVPVGTVAAGSAPTPAGAARRRSTSWQAWREPRTLLIGVVALAASFSEGSANNWLSLAVVDGFGRPEAVGGVVLGVFIGAMTLVRALGTRVIDRFGRVAVLRASGLTSLAGLLVLGLAPAFPPAVVGVAAWGLGAALAVPIAIAAAGDDPRVAAGRVAVVSSFATVASLVAPPVLGVAAEAVGARHALLLVGVALVASVAVSGRAAPLRAGGRRTAPSGALADAPTLHVPSPRTGQLAVVTAQTAC